MRFLTAEFFKQNQVYKFIELHKNVFVRNIIFTDFFQLKRYNKFYGQQFFTSL